jgi:hypothetical protein
LDDKNECPEIALVIAWDEAKREFNWFMHRDIPAHSLNGMLEIIKFTMVNTHMARQQAAQQVQILGPDAQPMRKRLVM